MLDAFDFRLYENNENHNYDLFDPDSISYVGGGERSIRDIGYASVSYNMKPYGKDESKDFPTDEEAKEFFDSVIKDGAVKVHMNNRIQGPYQNSISFPKEYSTPVKTGKMFTKILYPFEIFDMKQMQPMLQSLGFTKSGGEYKKDTAFADEIISPDIIKKALMAYCKEEANKRVIIKVKDGFKIKFESSYGKSFVWPKLFSSYKEVRAALDEATGLHIEYYDGSKLINKTLISFIQ